MKRTKRTLYILPDLSSRIDETASLGGQSPNAIIEAALDAHFARESMYSAVEGLIRRVGDVEEKIVAQQATLAKLETAISAIGRGVVSIREMLKPQQGQQGAVQEQPQPAREPEPEPAGSGRPSGWNILGRR